MTSTVLHRIVRSWDWAIPALVIIAAAILPPWSVFQKIVLLGYGICGRIPAHSFHIAGQQLPLCARCTGTYLGVLVGLLVILARGRGRASNLPPVGVLVTLILFFAAWAVDGLNSYLALLTFLPHLYEPSNLVRVITGTLEGLAIIHIFYPVFSVTLWREPRSDLRVLDGFHDLLVVAMLALGAAALANTELEFLLYPLALANALGVLAMFGMVNTLIVLIAARREGSAMVARDAVMPLLWGVAMSLIEIGMLDFVRGTLTNWTGLG